MENLLSDLQQTTTYITNQKKANQAVLHQLVQAFIREKVYEYEWATDNTAIIIPLREDGSIHIPVAQVYTLGHLDIHSDPIHKNKDGEERVIERPDHLLDLLFEGGDTGKNQSGFYHEIKNSAYNYALALTVAQYRTNLIKKDAIEIQASDAFDYALKKKHSSELFSPLTFFEQWVIQGHTIHPGSRTRLGLSPEDIARYAPEWEGQPSVIPLAIHKKWCKMTSMDGVTTKTILFREYPDVKEAFELMCIEKELAAEDYEIIPVHPWQFNHTILRNYKDDLKRRIIIPLETHIKTAALISFRTLAPFQNRENHHMKTAMNVQMTSAIRTVSAASTKNGPTLSRLFRDITANDQAFANCLTMTNEEVGIHFEPEKDTDPDTRHFLQKNAAAILRENPECSMKKGEVAIPAAALVAESPITGKLIAQEFVERHSPNTAAAFLETYARVLLPGLLTLITKYGISMEAHLQNCVVVFKDGWPQRVILRDNGGVRIMNERLDRFYAQSSIDSSTNLLTEKREELLDIFSHALLHNHLGEIIVALTRKMDIDEKSLWKAVRTVIQETYASMKEDPTTKEEALKDEGILFSRPSRMKALVEMRLSDQFTDNIYLNMANPLQSGNEVFNI